MHPSSLHLLVDFFDCDVDVLNDVQAVEDALCAASDAIGSKVVARAFHAFSPQGVTGVLVVEESHLAIHTWPETGYAAMDVFTCGDLDPQPALEVVKERFQAEKSKTLTVRRGESGDAS